MNRVIKYRAWDMGQKVNPNVPSCLNKKYVPKMVKVNAVYSENAIGFWDNMSYKKVTKNHYNFELMQFIGSKDKNDNEIYEGDIVKDEAGRIYLVKFGIYEREFERFIMSGNGWHLERLKENKIDYPSMVIGDWFEVIGNCFENPELL